MVVYGVQPFMDLEESKIDEQIANRVFNTWAQWLKFIFSNGKFNTDGSFTIPAKYVSKWTAIMTKRYNDLTEKQKIPSKLVAEVYLDVLRKFLQKKEKER